jgi:predicted component of type VI protein secretion system
MTLETEADRTRIGQQIADMKVIVVKKLNDLRALRTQLADLKTYMVGKDHFTELDQGDIDALMTTYKNAVWTFHNEFP